VLNINFKKYSENGTIKEISQFKSKNKESKFHAQTKPKYLFQEFLG
jgi:hypothetical protein